MGLILDITYDHFHVIPRYPLKTQYVISMKQSLLPSNTDNPLRTLDCTPRQGEMIKAAEAIDIIGVEKLTLQDQRIWNALIENAHGKKLGEEERDFVIDLSPLKANHNSTDRLEVSILKLMQTVATCRMPNGSTERFALLGGNNMGDPMRPRGEMTYSFDKRLTRILRQSGTFGKLELAVMNAFTSKYALALYEHMSKRVNLRFKKHEEFSVQEMRNMLRVNGNQLKAFGSFKQRALVPAIEEFNSWAPYTLSVAYKKTGQKVTSIVFTWFPKSGGQMSHIKNELKKSKIGREARRKKTVETVHVIHEEEVTEIIDNRELYDLDDSDQPL